MFNLYSPLFLANFKPVSPQWYSEACRRLPISLLERDTCAMIYYLDPNAHVPHT